MKKNIIWILLIFAVPLALYYGMARERITSLPVSADCANEVIKFYSPMCSECQELDEVFKEVYPKYSNKVSLRKIDVTQKDRAIRTLIKKYNVTLVPTTVFKNKNGDVTRRIEGTMQPRILENYMAELIDE